jgi:hypothetical protein
MGSREANVHYRKGHDAALEDSIFGRVTACPYPAWHKRSYPWRRGYNEFVPEQQHEPTSREQFETAFAATALDYGIDARDSAFTGWQLARGEIVE